MPALQPAPRHKNFDTHFHIIDSCFPLTPNQGYLPDEFHWKTYLDAARPLGVVGGAIVSGSFQAFNQITGLPRVSIDHLGLSKAGMPALLKLAERGAQVKATGFGRVDFDVAQASLG